MSRKDYVMIAGILSRSVNSNVMGSNVLTPEQRDDIAQMFARGLAADNAMFKRAVFLKACGVDQ